MNSLVLKIRNDAKVAIGKLAQYRQNGDNQNYKSLCDSIEILINMHNKSFFDIKVKTETLYFIEEISVRLNDEISLLSQCLEPLLNKDDIRDYRNCLISLEKLNSIQTKVRDEYSHIKRSELLNKM